MEFIIVEPPSIAGVNTEYTVQMDRTLWITRFKTKWESHTHIWVVSQLGAIAVQEAKCLK